MLNLFNTDAKLLKKITKTISKIDNFKQKYAEMSENELKLSTQRFKETLSAGKTVEDLMPEVFAAFNEATKRHMGFELHQAQFIAAAVLHGGDLAEQNCGEGKSLTGAMCAYLDSLEGKGVHIITVNEYLAERDCEEEGAIFELLGSSCGLNKTGLTKAEKQNAYNCDITYTTNSEVGFDYLRDNMVTNIKDRVLRPLHFAIIDEADSILIDDARTPLIISGPSSKKPVLYTKADSFVKTLKPEDYEIHLREKVVAITESGIAKAEKYYGLDNLYDPSNTALVHAIQKALHANYVLKNEIDYLVEDKEVFIIDPNTGRKMVGREWSDGLHQAVQAKEHLPIKEESMTIATITYQNFFRLYDKLAGMTGTAKTEEEEFLEIYNMRVLVVPPNKPVQRIDKDDLIFGTKNDKYNHLIKTVKELHANGQPILIGTVAVETSELLSKLLDKEHLPHNVLNAKNHAREAEIIALAGQKNAITIATNMAGRGTDIKLGDGVRELGGLAVLGSERHESRRIDNQLRGRSGRQGDPGTSQFFVSLEDDLMKRFGAENIQSLFSVFNGEPIQNRHITKSLNEAQKRVEGYNYDIRKSLMQYDNVSRQQRETMYAQRNQILEEENIREIILDSASRRLREVLSKYITCSPVDYEGVEYVFRKLTLELPENYKSLPKEKLADCLVESFVKSYEERTKEIDNIQSVEKFVTLQIIDTNWMQQIDTMANLKDGVGLRGYAQQNPIQVYTNEGFDLFEEMNYRIRDGILSFCATIKRKDA